MLGVPTRPRPPQSVVHALGKRVRQLRRRQNWTQEDLAEAAGLHRTFIGGVEVGLRNPSLASLARIAHALQVSLADLFGRD